MRLHHLAQNGGNDTATETRAPVPAWLAWLETTGLVALAIAVGALVDRSDPFLVRRGFSWLALAPVLAGLQHGSTRGLGGAALQALALTVAWRSGLTAMPEAPAETVLGWLIAGLAAGEFRDHWLRRIGHLGGTCEHFRRRLESLGRAYLALKISHDRLQRSAPAAGPSLREALCSLRNDVAARCIAPHLEALGDRILALFADHAFVRAATLHPVDRKGRPARAMATLGAATDPHEDALVRKAARTGLTVSIREGGEGSVLVAVPLIDLSCRAHAVVAVQDIPFLDLNTETLELLAVLGGRIGEVIAGAPAPAVRRAQPAAAEESLPAPDVAPLPAPVKEVA
jgi:hypothetical protein